MQNRNQYTIWIAYFAFIVIGMAAGLLNVAWELVRVTFDLPLDALGILLTFSVIGGITAAFLSGQIIGRIGVAAFLVVGSILQILGLLGFAIAPHWWLLVITGIFISGGSSIIDTTMNTFASERFGTREMNWLHAAFGIGLTIAPLVVKFLAIDNDLGWQAAYLFGAALQAILLVLLLWTFNTWKIGEIDAITGKEKRRSAPIMDTLRKPMVLLLIMLFFVYVGLEIGTGQLTNTLFIESRGIDPSESAQWISIYWGSFTIGRILMGIFAKYVRNGFIMRAAMIFSLIGAALLWTNITVGLGFFGLVLLGFAQAPIFPVLITQMPERIGSEHVANTVGFSIAAVNVGFALLPSFGAVMATTFGLESIGFILTALAVIMFINYEAIVFLDSRRARRKNHTVAGEVTVGD